MEKLPLLRHLPRQHVLRPREVVFLKAAEKRNCILVGDVTEVVDGNRHFPADCLAHIRHILLEVVQPFLGNVDARERVRRVEEIVGFPAHGAGID